MHACEKQSVPGKNWGWGLGANTDVLLRSTLFMLPLKWSNQSVPSNKQTHTLLPIKNTSKHKKTRPIAFSIHERVLIVLRICKMKHFHSEATKKPDNKHIQILRRIKITRRPLRAEQTVVPALLSRCATRMSLPVRWWGFASYLSF